MAATEEQLRYHDNIKAMGLVPVPPEDQPYGVEIHTADGCFVKQISIPKKGSVVAQHKHHWDHTSVLAYGSVILWKDGVINGRYDAPQGILIKAGVAHSFQTVTDNTVILCIHGIHSEEAQKLLREHGIEGEV